MITTMKVEKSTLKEVRIAKIKYMAAQNLTKCTTDKLIKLAVKNFMVLLEKNTK